MRKKKIQQARNLASSKTGPPLATIQGIRSMIENPPEHQINISSAPQVISNNLPPGNTIDPILINKPPISILLLL